MADDDTFSLTIGGDRTSLVTAEEARDIVVRLQAICDENEGLRLTKVDISKRTYMPEAIPILAEFFASARVHHVVELDMNNVIASLPTEEGFAVLEGISDMFKPAKLQILNASQNAFGGARGLESIDGILHAGLQELYLGDNGIALAGMEILRNRFAGSEHLRVIRLHNNMIGPEGAVLFATIVGSCPSLQDVQYAGVRAGVDGTRAVVLALAGNEQLNLVKLDLEDGSLYSEDEDDSVDSLVALLTRCSDLVDLNIEGCSLEDDGMIRVCHALLESQCFIETLNVSGNELTPACCNALRDLLDRNSDNLLVLKADANELTSIGVRTLLGAYQDDDTVLQVLHLSTNQLAHIAAVALEQVRPQLNNLVELKVNENGFIGRDITRLENAFGDVLVEIVDNYSDEEYDEGLSDEEDDEIEEEIAVVEEEDEEDEEEEVEQVPNDVDLLSQMMANANFQNRL